MIATTRSDIEGLQRAGLAVATTLRVMLSNLKPGVTTARLDQIGEEALTRQGARSAPRLAYNFPGATCISVCPAAAHGIPGDRVLQGGDLVNIDVSAELDGYYADVAMSAVVPPAPARELELCLAARRALKSAIAVIKPGVRINEIGYAIEQQARREGLAVIRNLCGHGLGRSLHEEPGAILSYYDSSDNRILKQGHVIAIEPFLSTGADEVQVSGDGWTLVTPDNSAVAQHEHTILVTRRGPRILTPVPSP